MRSLFRYLDGWPEYVRSQLNIRSLSTANFELLEPECSMGASDIFVVKYIMVLFWPLAFTVALMVHIMVGVCILCNGTLFSQK